MLDQNFKKEQKSEIYEICLIFCFVLDVFRINLPLKFAMPDKAVGYRPIKHVVFLETHAFFLCSQILKMDFKF